MDVAGEVVLPATQYVDVFAASPQLSSANNIAAVAVKIGNYNEENNNNSSAKCSTTSSKSNAAAEEEAPPLTDDALLQWIDNWQAWLAAEAGKTRRARKKVIAHIGLPMHKQMPRTHRYARKHVLTSTESAAVHARMMSVISRARPSVLLQNGLDDRYIRACQYCQQPGLYHFWPTPCRACSFLCQRMLYKRERNQQQQQQQTSSDASSSSPSSEKQQSAKTALRYKPQLMTTLTIKRSIVPNNSKNKVLLATTKRRRSSSACDNSRFDNDESAIINVWETAGATPSLTPLMESRTCKVVAAVAKQPSAAKVQAAAACNTAKNSKQPTKRTKRAAAALPSFTVDRDVLARLEHKHLTDWTKEEVANYMANSPMNMGADVPHRIIRDCIDGQALELLTVEHLINDMHLPFGAALKIRFEVERLKAKDGYIAT